MRVIIAGTRVFENRDWIYQALHDAGFPITEVLSGGARGPDTIGAEWAAERGIPVRWFHPDWKAKGSAAGPIRNLEMAASADALIIIWDGASAGSRHMLDTMRRQGKPVFESLVPPEVMDAEKRRRAANHDDHRCVPEPRRAARSPAPPRRHLRAIEGGRNGGD